MDNLAESSPAGLLSIELIVESMERALELFSGILGLEVLSRGPSSLVAGEVAMIDAGGCVITLLEPSAAGDGTILSERTPRLSQIVLASPSAEALRNSSMRAGLAVVPLAGDSFYMTPEAVAGALGQRVAVVVTSAGSR